MADFVVGAAAAGAVVCLGLLAIMAYKYSAMRRRRKKIIEINNNTAKVVSNTSLRSTPPANASIAPVHVSPAQNRTRNNSNSESNKRRTLAIIRERGSESSGISQVSQNSSQNSSQSSSQNSRSSSSLFISSASSDEADSSQGFSELSGLLHEPLGGQQRQSSVFLPSSSEDEISVFSEETEESESDFSDDMGNNSDGSDIHN